MTQHNRLPKALARSRPPSQTTAAEQGEARTHGDCRGYSCAEVLTWYFLERCVAHEPLEPFGVEAGSVHRYSVLEVQGTNINV